MQGRQPTNKHTHDSVQQDSFLAHFKPYFDEVMQARLHDLITEAKKIAAELMIDFDKRYKSQLNPKHKPFFLDPYKDRHIAKAKSARELYSFMLSGMGVLTLSQHCIDDDHDLKEMLKFVKAYRKAITLNKSLDQSAGKCGSGTYGEILGDFYDRVESLAYDIDLYIKACMNVLTEYTKFYQAHLAYFNEVSDLINSSDKNVTLSHLQDYKLIDIKNRLCLLFDLDAHGPQMQRVSKSIDSDSDAIITKINAFHAKKGDTNNPEVFLNKLLQEVSRFNRKYAFINYQSSSYQLSDFVDEYDYKKHLAEFLFQVESRGSIIFLKKYLREKNQSNIQTRLDSADSRRMECALACYSHGKMHTQIQDGMHGKDTYQDPFRIHYLTGRLQNFIVRCEGFNNIVDTSLIESALDDYVAKLEDDYQDDRDMTFMLASWKIEFAKLKEVFVDLVKHIPLQQQKKSQNTATRSLLLFAQKQEYGSNPFATLPKDVVQVIGDYATRTEPKM